MKKVLITIPIDGRKDYVLDEFKSYVMNFLPISDVIIVNTGDIRYEARLRSKLPFAEVVNLTKSETMGKTEFMYALRAKQRELFLSSDSSYHMMLDSDVLVPSSVFSTMVALLDQGNHWAGPWYVMGYRRGDYWYPEDARPLAGGCRVMQTAEKQGLDNLSREELKLLPETFETEMIPLGCSLLSRKIMEDIKFEYCSLLQVGEDVMWYGNASDKGYKAICINIEVDHISNGASQTYYDTKTHFEAVLRQGDNICKNVDLTELRETAKLQCVN